MHINQKIGERIKTRRKELELTQERVGNIVGVTKSTIQRYENGLIKDLKMPVIQAIANALKVNPDWLVLKSDTKELQSNNNSLKSINLSKNELKLVNAYNLLNDTGKQEAQKRVEELTLIDKYSNNDEISDDEYITIVAARGDSKKKVRISKETIRKDLENYTPPEEL